MKFLPKPRGLWRLHGVERPHYMAEDVDPVLVSLCGREAPFQGILIEAEPERDYDWTALRGWYVAVLVRPGIKATKTVAGLMPHALPYIQVVDLTQWKRWAIDSLEPRLKGWPERMPERPDGWK